MSLVWLAGHDQWSHCKLKLIFFVDLELLWVVSYTHIILHSISLSVIIEDFLIKLRLLFWIVVLPDLLLKWIITLNKAFIYCCRNILVTISSCPAFSIIMITIAVNSAIEQKDSLILGISVVVIASQSLPILAILWIYWLFLSILCRYFLYELILLF